MNVTFKNLLTIEMFQTKYGNNWLCSFLEEVKNLKCLTHDDGRTLIEIGHQSLLMWPKNLMLHDSCYKYYKGSDCQETETQLSAKYCPTTAKQFFNVTALSLLDDSFSVFVFFVPCIFKKLLICSNQQLWNMSFLICERRIWTKYDQNINNFAHVQKK